MDLTAAAADVVFAQKATAIVKSAGMDPKSIDLETFRLNAPLIFSHAYSAIFREELYTVLHENSSMEDKILNAQLVLDGLYSRTRIPVLLDIKGNDLYEGSHRAVGIVVGVLFSEGQRMWLEKVRLKSSSVLPDVKSSEEQVEHAVALSVEGDSQSSSNLVGQRIQDSLKSLNQMKASKSEVSHADLEKLLSRISYLEERLTRRRHYRRSNKLGRDMSREPRLHSDTLNQKHTNHHSNTLHQKHTNHQPSGESERDPSQVVPRGGRRKAKRSKKKKKKTSARILDDTMVEDFHDDVDGDDDDGHNYGDDGDDLVVDHKVSRQRPRSAPTWNDHQTHRRTLGPPTRRMFTPASIAQVIHHQEPVRKASPPPKYNENGEEYTYDLNGRRILLSQAQLAAEERRRMMEAMGAILMLQTSEMEYTSKPRRPSSAPSSPVRYQAQYPSKSIGANVGNWLKRMGHPKSSSQQPAKPVEEHTKTEMQPRYFGAYEKMEALDLIFSIEYCHSCECHNTTTRHKAEEYFQKTSSYCQLLAEMSHQLGVSARVGVTRIKADVSNNIAGAASSRVGAFEIQVAFKSTSDRVTPTILHSKILICVKVFVH
jgi:hypothetical protein